MFKKNIYILTIIACGIILHGCNKEEDAISDNGEVAIEGCTDETAVNYDENATVDDGSCIILGCTDETAVNYNPNATNDDGSCEFSTEIEGCTDETAVNYDENATVDDGSCIILGCTDPNAENYNPNATNDDGSCEFSTEYILNGTWNIISLEYSALLDLEIIQQNISGQAYDAGTWEFDTEEYIYTLDLNFETEPFTISIPVVGDYDVPSFPVENSSTGTWSLNNSGDEITALDTNTGTVSSYVIISLTDATAVIQGVLPFSAMGVEQDINIDMVLEKQ